MLVFTNKINEIDMRRGNKKYILLLPTAIIIPFFSFFLYSVSLNYNPLSIVRSNILTSISNVKYETFKLSFDDSVPEYLRDDVISSLKDLNFKGKNRFEFVDGKSNYLLTDSVNGDSNILLENTLVPVGHIYWLKDGIKESELKDKSVKILVKEDEEERNIEFLEVVLGTNIEMSSSNDLVNELKKSENTIAFVKPSDITKEMKVLKLDGNSYLDSSKGAYNAKYVLKSEEDDSDFVFSLIQKHLDSNSAKVFEREKLVKINMTGVTAISRGLAVKIDALKDYDYPSKSIGKFLADADLTHTSNEVSFVEGCAVYSGMRFCSNPSYMETLLSSGIDIVELTGNHNNDFGSQNNAKSINMYKEEGMEYFGGGLNREDAEKILYKEVKGSTVAFLGYNYYDTMLKSGAIASDYHAGANSYSIEKLKNNIEEAKKNADVVIVDFQFQECYSYPPSDVIYPICYKPLSSPDQKGVFRQAVDFGADIVIGTQAHQPQTYESYNGGLIYYGLGNLYFDQTRWIGTRQGIVLSLYVLDGELIQVGLTPTIYDKDMVTRLANSDESRVLLEQLKQARTF